MKGFTLIELLVVIAILAILVVAAVPSYNSYNKEQKLSDAARQLQTILRQAQNNAQTGTVCEGTIKAISWNIQLRSDSPNNMFYLFFADCEDTTIRRAQTVTLPSNITFSSIRTDTGFPSFIKIAFKNVNSAVEFIDPTGGYPDTTNGKLGITLSLAGSSATKKVVVEKGGGIYVEQ